jgi:hypothetical protein
VLFPELVRNTGLDKAFDAFFNMARDALEKNTRNIERLFEKHPEWLASMLRRPVLVQVSSISIGDNISWILGEDVDTARDISDGRRLFMDQVLLTKPVYLTLYKRDNRKPARVKVSGTTREILETIRVFYTPSNG